MHFLKNRNNKKKKEMEKKALFGDKYLPKKVIQSI